MSTTIDDYDGPGTLEILERVPGKITFQWLLHVKHEFEKVSIKETEVKSSTLWFRDQSNQAHGWNLIFHDSFFEFYYEGIVTPDRLTIEYCGWSSSPTVGINFRITSSDKVGEMPCKCYYDDTSSRNAPHDFAKKRSYSIDISSTPKVKDDGFRLRIYCTITENPNNVDQNRMFLTHHELSLMKEYELLFKSGRLSDVSFIVNQRKIQLHKNILSSRSPVFAAMFNHEFEEDKTDEVPIEDQTYEVMLEFFRYIYSAHVNDMKDHASKLLITADKYAVDGLKVLCEQYLINDIKNENILEYSNLANCYNAKDLETECLKFIASNARELNKIPGFSINKLSDDLINKLSKLQAENPDN